MTTGTGSAIVSVVATAMISEGEPMDATVKLTITNSDGEVYATGTITMDARGRWWITDQDGDIVAPDELFADATNWATMEMARAREIARRRASLNS